MSMHGPAKRAAMEILPFGRLEQMATGKSGAFAPLLVGDDASLLFTVVSSFAPLTL
ncbi:MAG: hypothetical protein WCD04_16055 [Terriglobia bacterium]